MKFDFCIGNPPYQEEAQDTSDKPVYNSFMEAAYSIADKVEMITPARFLFNAGKTPKAWNEKMLNDSHFKVSYYEQDSSKVFSNTEIKGGVAIHYWDKDREFGAIGVFSQYEEMRSITNKIKAFVKERSLTDIMHLQNRFLLDVLYADHPEYKDIISSDGKERRIVSSSFDKLDVFHKEVKTANDIRILGVAGANTREYRWIDRKYIENNGNTDKYKVIVPKVNGAGKLGEVLSMPQVLEKDIGYTQSFIGIGAFETKEEAENALKYIKTKFARTMLGILKITQDNPPEKWKYVPVPDFTNSSDIEWGNTIAAIDEQLFSKYGLSESEAEFIKNTAKEMV